MSTAQEIIEDGYKRSGRKAEILNDPAQTLLNDALPILISMLETLRKQDIILEETESGVTTTIAVPTVLGSELDEPAAARDHLVNIMAVMTAGTARVNLAGEGKTIPTVAWSRHQLALMYRQHTISKKVPSKLMPRGQGAKQGRISSTFFQGEALDVDATDLT